MPLSAKIAAANQSAQSVPSSTQPPYSQFPIGTGSAPATTFSQFSGPGSSFSGPDSAATSFVPPQNQGGSFSSNHSPSNYSEPWYPQNGAPGQPNYQQQYYGSPPTGSQAQYQEPYPQQQGWGPVTNGWGSPWPSQAQSGQQPVGSWSNPPRQPQISSQETRDQDEEYKVAMEKFWREKNGGVASGSTYGELIRKL